MTKYKHEYRMHTVYCDRPVSYNRFYTRIREGMPVDIAIKTGNKNTEILKHYKKHKKLHGDDSVSYNVFRLRMNKRSIKKSINTPNMGKGGNRSKTRYKEERQTKFENLKKHYSYSEYFKRRKKGMSEKEAIEKY